jgi:hypothetical protein
MHLRKKYLKIKTRYLFASGKENERKGDGVA